MSRASQLARLQVSLVERALRAAHPGLEIACVTRASAGDRDQTSPLWQLADKGAFTSDLSGALVRGEADLVVHSFKDLPIEPPAGTSIVATLERADPRDVLLVRRAAAAERPSSINVLSSSPRRAWLLQQVLPDLLPWPLQQVTTEAVRGNVETRLRKLVEGDAFGLVMAKAALDRLLTFGSPYDEAAATIRGYLAQCHWMVMPMRDFPWAPAQGAVAIEAATDRADLRELLAPISHGPTWRAVAQERAILSAHGGGCHLALGAAVIERDYGRVISVRAHLDDGAEDVRQWTIGGREVAMPRTTRANIWPRPDDTLASTRRSIAASVPPAGTGLWVTRSEALPDGWATTPDTPVWVSGSQTWRRLAARGVWVHGSADGLGEEEHPAIDALAGRDLSWLRVTHQGAVRDGELATYAVETQLPEDLGSRTHLFWTSGHLFTRALGRWPSLRSAWHASGPGRTRQTILAALGSAERTGVWLDRDAWEKDVCQ